MGTIIPGWFFDWDNTDAAPRKISEAIAAMDLLTWQALITGQVELPRRRIHAGLWFRLLRTLLDELNTPLSQYGVYAATIRHVWECCGRPLRAGQHHWRTYEMLDLAVQLQMLEAVATSINLIESEKLKPYGELAGLFLPEPQAGFHHLAMDKGKKEPFAGGVQGA